MRILLNVLAVMLLGWPALFVGYIATAIKSGYLTGAHLYNKHEEEALDKFVYRVKVETEVPNAQHNRPASAGPG